MNFFVTYLWLKAYILWELEPEPTKKPRSRSKTDRLRNTVGNTIHASPLSCTVRQIKTRTCSASYNFSYYYVPMFCAVLKWCSLDRIIFIRAYRMLLKRLKVKRIQTSSFFHHSILSVP